MGRKSKHINILVAGGSGHWAQLNHYPSILYLKKDGIPIRVVAICDNRNPRKEASKPSLREILKNDNPFWISPRGKSDKRVEKELDKVHHKHHIDIILVSTNPVHHYFYSYWGAKNKINILCDKPLVVTPNASFYLPSARKIQANYVKLSNLVKKNQELNPRYAFCLPLRRRALKPFVRIAKHLERVYKKTGEGIRYMNVIINGGVHKYPVELLKGGAHGYLDGFGALSHSSYHYIDVIAWYLTLARGDIAKIHVRLPYIFRVRDYLNIKGYAKLKQLIEDRPEDLDDNIELPQQVLNSELDFTFHLKLLDKDNNPIGMTSYTSNHTTFTPRRTKYIPEMLEYTNDKIGGRMSQIYFDIHQGAVQNWQLIKNDVVFFGNTIDIIGRIHPRLGKWVIRERYTDAYNKNTITPKDLFMSFVKHCAGIKVQKKYINLLSSFENQDLTNRLFSKFYEKIAEDFHNKKHPRKKIKVDPIIAIDKFI